MKHKQSAQPIQSGKKMGGENCEAKNCETKILLRDENCKNERLIECNEPILLKLKNKISLLKKKKTNAEEKCTEATIFQTFRTLRKAIALEVSHTT